VLALAVHKQLQTVEIGHSALHGAWDRLDAAERFASRSFRWETPIDEASWRRAHNVRHHIARLSRDRRGATLASSPLPCRAESTRS
jgi:hypothetical protein